MLLYEVMSDDFIVVPEGSGGERLKAFYRGLKPAYVIFPSKEGYYLLSSLEVEELLTAPAGPQTLGKTLEDRFVLSPTMNAFVNADDAPDRCVVTDEDEVIGFFDATQGAVLNIKRGAHPESAEYEIAEPYRLCADFPEKIGLGDTVSLLVSISRNALCDENLGFSLRAGDTVELIVRVRSGLSLVGNGEGRLSITDEDEPLPIQFKIRGDEEGIAGIDIFAFCQGQPLGKISISPSVVKMYDTDAVVRDDVSRKLAAINRNQAELTLLIFEEGDRSAPILNFYLYAPEPSLEHNYTRFTPVDLKTDPLRYVEGLFLDIEQLPMESTKDREIAEFKLAVKGNLLFEQLIPDELKSVLWSMKDHIRSVQVLSDEAWIPWELCKLQGQDGNGIIDGPFFCEAFAITRWMQNIGRKPVLSMNNVGVVVPGDSGLNEAEKEKRFILSLANESRKVSLIPAETLKVAKAMQSGAYDCWHFSGHGVAHQSEPNRSRIILEDNEVMHPEDISGTVCNMGKPNPLVFLNACQTGRGAFSLTHVGGWAARFLKAGVGAFVGTYWSVQDDSAYLFCKTFYGELLKGSNVGDATRKARLSIRKSGDPTWLAYTVYGDPIAHMAGFNSGQMEHDDYR